MIDINWMSRLPEKGSADEATLALKLDKVNDWRARGTFKLCKAS